MNITEAFIKLRDDIKTWTTNNLKALDQKIEDKSIPIDSELSSTSTNPVENKVVQAKTEELSVSIKTVSSATSSVAGEVQNI
jgi:hypothetical protein